MGKTYATPTAFRTALNLAAKKMSKETGMNVSDLMRIFYFNRLAARVFTLDPDGWLIKGGQALLVRYRGAARLSGDIDLQAAQPGLAPEEARARVLEAAAHDLGDFLRFAPGKYTTSADPDRGGSQHFQVFLGPTRVDGVKVDIAVRRTLTGAPETTPLVSAVDLPWPVDWPVVRLYPLIDHIADKVCALYERHPQGTSSRYRDLADLLLISQREKINGAAACQAIHQEAEQRRQGGIDVTLPRSFEVPGPDWHDKYPSAAALVLGLQGCRTLPEAVQAAQTFLDPLLDSTVAGDWDPARAAWRHSDS
ncbi:nucleotidyl transferase AbiEii/AbiGii toxin family protein [Streptomyces caniscabiei]|uniref:Nucleotidyl transferase AbiEii/AbiGii toxin family protein n=2 Tax=Streptomyces caniscabiei TaxID=2746961 RepID=A0A927LDV1_9ACTN|nr:nucleotidyl transferase AbiEii/AbiGii toxin family protein [Streptomyces caniscabiei]MBD9704123.1 nucleotidyl transferase AbiEii/AbiGii toxin family protein [Streptomyces caniscabiei]MBD9729306.1 nucleotidyl transferase AbiEii/AbiGii toxin family protein [Streptomyces caniscabiei]MDX3514972.1 nucleotidyl transferase AbiEii/AbiGii toxin family protein [Streptomyces caniscabiei]MDX3724408.1 nucleotidyl transferase AbiEii/AbiGii toxin family protein [Streptomyces caniscabiei]MDX3733367.1 nucle